MSHEFLPETPVGEPKSSIMADLVQVMRIIEESKATILVHPDDYPSVCDEVDKHGYWVKVLPSQHVTSGQLYYCAPLSSLGSRTPPLPGTPPMTRTVTITFEIDEDDTQPDDWHHTQAERIVAQLWDAPQSWTYQGTEVAHA